MSEQKVHMLDRCDMDLIVFLFVAHSLGQPRNMNYASVLIINASQRLMPQSFLGRIKLYFLLFSFLCPIVFNYKLKRGQVNGPLVSGKMHTCKTMLEKQHNNASFYLVVVVPFFILSNKNFYFRVLPNFVVIF